MDAADTEPTYIVPPTEFYPEGNVLWKLNKAIYGLRNAPKLWQDHFAAELQKLGLVRLKSDPNLYYDYAKQTYLLVYVDDVMLFGPKAALAELVQQIQSKVLLQVTGHLVPGETVKFLGRQLTHNGDSVHFSSLNTYVDDVLAEFDLSNCKMASTPGTTALKRVLDADEPVTTEQHKMYRRAVGKLQWLSPIRPDINFATKELARGLNGPT